MDQEQGRTDVEEEDRSAVPRRAPTFSRSVRLFVRPKEIESQGVEGGENKRITIGNRIQKHFAKMANGVYD